MRRVIGTLLAATLLAGLAVVPAIADGDEPTIAEIVIDLSGTDGPDNNEKDFDILLAAVLADEVLTEAVTGTGAFEGVDLTVFGPRDDAFMILTDTDNEADAVAAIDNLLGVGSEALRNVVLGHVIAGADVKSDVFFDDYKTKKMVEMADGNEIQVRWVKIKDGSGNNVRLNWKNVDLDASNGVFHGVRRVILNG